MGNSLPFLPPLFPGHCKGQANAPWPSWVGPLGSRTPKRWPTSSPTGSPTALGVWQDGKRVFTTSSPCRPLEPQSTKEEGWTDFRGQLLSLQEILLRKWGGRVPTEKETGTGVGRPVGRGSGHPGHCPKPSPMPPAPPQVAWPVRQRQAGPLRGGTRLPVPGQLRKTEDMPSRELGSAS